MVAIRATDVKVFFRKIVMLRKLGVEIMKNAKYLVFISPFYYKDDVIDTYVPENLREEMKKKSIVIPNGVDKFWLDNMDMRESIFKGKRDNIFLCRKT